MVTSRDKNDDVIIIVTSQKRYSYIRSYLTQENTSTKFQGSIINFSRVLVGGASKPPPAPRNIFDTPHQVGLTQEFYRKRTRLA